jgi:hypothetical protein
MRVTEVPSCPAQGPRLVVWLIQGKSHATIRLDGLCHYCGEDALTELPPRLLERQHDGTTVVCHASLGGCNRGFARIDASPTLAEAAS